MEIKKLLLLMAAITAFAGCAASAQEMCERGVYLSQFTDPENVEKAREAFTGAMKADPAMGEAPFHMALLEYKQGRYPRALELMERAVDLFKASMIRGNLYHEAFHYRAQFAVKAGAPKNKAISYWRKYYEVMQTSPNISMEAKGKLKKRVEGIIRDLQRGVTPGGRERAKLRPLDTPKLSGRDVFSAVRKCLAEGAFPSVARHPEFAEKYEGALYVTMFPEKGRRVNLVGGGGSLFKALQIINREIPEKDRDLSGGRMVVSWVTDASGEVREENVSADFTPGVDGLSIAGSLFRYSVLPEEAAWGAYGAEYGKTAESYVKSLQNMIIPGEREITYRIFRVKTFYQEKAGAEVVELFRAHERRGKVDRGDLRRSLVMAGEYLLRHQRDNGLYTYLWHAKNAYAERDESLIRQAGTAWSVLKLARLMKRADFEKSGLKAVEYFRGALRGDDERGFKYLVDGEKGANVGIAALTALALFEATKTGKCDCDEDLRGLLDFLVSQQRKDGSFKTHFAYKPSEDYPHPPSKYYPQEAVYALAEIGRGLGDEKLLAAARKGAKYLLDEKRENPRAAARVDHWLVMGIDVLEDAGGGLLNAGPVFEVIEKVMELRNTDGPADVRGSIDTTPFPRGPTAATLNEAFGAAGRMLKRRKKSASRIEEVMRGLAAFQLRHQVTETDSYYMKEPDKARGGFRLTLLSDEIRVDFQQHNVLGLLEALEVMEK